MVGNYFPVLFLPFLLYPKVSEDRRFRNPYERVSMVSQG